MNYISINNGDLGEPVNNGINNSNSNNNKNEIVASNQIIDHVIFVIHGIGKHEEKWTEKIIRINQIYQNITKVTEKNKNVVFIGLEWHSGVHKTTDQFIKKVTPKSIPVVRELINHTLLDILFFTSPTFSQHIYTEVGTKLNQLYKEFKKKNPTFKGKVSLLAHSLGSMISYDILCHQNSNNNNNGNSNNSLSDDYDEDFNDGNINYWKKFKKQKLKQQQNNNNNNNNSNNNNNNNNNNSNSNNSNNDDTSSDEEDNDIFNEEVDGEKDFSKFLPDIIFPKLEFDVYNLYCIGSPIGTLCTIRGHQSLDIPKCVNLYNIYDQSDPVASLIEPLIDDGFTDLQESQAPHFSAKKKYLSTNKPLEPLNNNNSNNNNNTANVNNNNTNINNNINNTNNNSTNNNNNNINNNSMFSKFSSKLSSFKSSISKTTTTGNNSVQQLTLQEPVPKTSSKPISEETEMASFDGASMKRNQSFNSYNNISDVENDDDLSEKSNSSSYNIEYINNLNNNLNNFNFNTDSNTSPTKRLDIDNNSPISTPNKPLPALPNQQNSNNNQTPLKESNISSTSTTTPSSSTSSSNTTTTSSSSNKQFFGGHRFDFKLKPNGILSFSDYSSVPIAHKSYWESKDVMYFISERLSSNKII